MLLWQLHIKEVVLLVSRRWVARILGRQGSKVSLGPLAVRATSLLLIIFDHSQWMLVMEEGIRKNMFIEVSIIGIDIFILLSKNIIHRHIYWL